MPRQQARARLWLRPAEKDSSGRVVRPSTWYIKDGGTRRSLGFSALQFEEAEQALSDYLTTKHRPDRHSERSASEIRVVDVLNIYLEDIVPTHARPAETGQRIAAIAGFFADKVLSDINGSLCRAYVRHRTSQAWKSAKNSDRRVTEAAPRRELEDLRAAINHHRREGLCTEIVSVALPAAAAPRERWLSRSEAARLLWAAWRARQKSGTGDLTKRSTGKHLARFILVALYTGTRAGAVCGASFEVRPGSGYLDLDRGVFYRRAAGERETNKRKPPVRLPARLLAHMRRWRRLGISQDYLVEWAGEPVASVRKSFAAAAASAGLGPDVTPHILRHTAATWLMQAGVPVWEAAGYLGMTPELLTSKYGHHHPDHMSEAVEAMNKRSGTGLVPIDVNRKGTKRTGGEQNRA